MNPSTGLDITTGESPKSSRKEPGHAEQVVFLEKLLRDAINEIAHLKTERPKSFSTCPNCAESTRLRDSAEFILNRNRSIIEAMTEDERAVLRSLEHRARTRLEFGNSVFGFQKVWLCGRYPKRGEL